MFGIVIYVCVLYVNYNITMILNLQDFHLLWNNYNRFSFTMFDLCFVSLYNNKNVKSSDWDW